MPETSAVDSQALYDRMQAMIELLKSTQEFLVRSGAAIGPPTGAASALTPR
jgi:hypothetical protein